MCGCLSHDPYWGPGPQPRQVPCPGIDLGTPLVCRSMLHPLSHTSWGLNFFFIVFILTTLKTINYIALCEEIYY